MGNENYYPGTVHIKLLKYKGKSLTANRISKFKTSTRLVHLSIS